MTDVPLGEYKHRSGTIYNLIAIANTKATKPGWVVTAVYQDGIDYWTRPLDEFLKSCQKI